LLPHGVVGLDTYHDASAGELPRRDSRATADIHQHAVGDQLATLYDQVHGGDRIVRPMPGVLPGPAGGTSGRVMFRKSTHGLPPPGNARRPAGEPAERRRIDPARSIVLLLLSLPTAAAEAEAAPAADLDLGDVVTLVRDGGENVGHLDGGLQL